MSGPHREADKLDLAAYRIEQGRIKNTTPPDGLEAKEWQNFLVFPHSKIRVPLARAGTTQGEPCGFNPLSLKVRWLKPDKLLLISWTTFYLGSGGYTHDGNVILQITGDKSQELFRDYFKSCAKAGWASQNYSTLEITYDDSDKILKLTRTDTEIDGDIGPLETSQRVPFTDKFTIDNGQTGYISKIKTIDTRHYRLAGARLKFLHGSSAVDVGDEAQPVDDIVNAFHVTRADLASLNPSLTNRVTTTGVVVFSKRLKPYQASSNDDGLGGDK